MQHQGKGNGVPLQWKTREYDTYLADSKCHICTYKIKEVKDKVADHDHFTGEYLNS